MRPQSQRKITYISYFFMENKYTKKVFTNIGLVAKTNKQLKAISVISHFNSKNFNLFEHFGMVFQALAIK